MTEKDLQLMTYAEFLRHAEPDFLGLAMFDYMVSLGFSPTEAENVNLSEYVLVAKAAIYARGCKCT